MLAALTALLSSSGLGALVGLAGSYLTKNEERKAQKDRFAHDEKMAELATEEARFEAEAKLKIVEAEGAIAADVAAYNAFEKSQDEVNKTYGGKVDQVRGLMRPAITAYLLALSTLASLQIYRLMGGFEALSESELTSIFSTVIDQILFLTTTAVTWWFGSRPSQSRKG